MKVKTFTNQILSSNSYIIHKNQNNSVWIIDPGDSDQLLEWLTQNKKKVKGILLTHYHVDHIYGVNEIKENFKDVFIYASEKSKEGLFSAKINGSYYLEIPLTLEDNNIIYVRNGSTIELWNDFNLKVFETPGHNDDCISFFTDGKLFTGDALIPGVKVHIRSKKANKDLAYSTIDWIKTNFNEETLIFPGHKKKCQLKDIKIVR